MTQINQNNTQNTSTEPQEAIKTKIVLQNHKTRNSPLNTKSKTKEVSILAKNNKHLIIEQNYIYINATKAGAPCFKIIAGLLVKPP